MPNILERLLGTSSRMRDMISGYSDKLLSQAGNGWSIKQHIGHLADLEELHDRRIDDMIARKENLRPADMTNKKTNEARHNEQDIEQLIRLFENNRNRFVERLTALDDSTQVYKAMHPRLHVMMRPVDVAYFTAEHDDHHLASIRSILDMEK